MIQYIKNKFLEDSNKIVEFLEYFEFKNIRINSGYISFGRSENSSQKGITLYLNEYLGVVDWSRNIKKDLFNYIIYQKNIEFYNVINVARNILGIKDFYYNNENNEAFNGLFNRIKKKNEIKIKVYPYDILNNYEKACNKMFLDDGISIEAQKHFHIMFDKNSQSIVIPIKNDVGDLIGVKMRTNIRKPDDNQLRYWYDIPCKMSQVLYGYSDNYEFLESANVIYIGESEKFVMQLWSYGFKNCVALGSGTISRKQISLLFSLHPKSIVLLHDVGYSIESVNRNIDAINNYSGMFQVKIGYWNYFDKNYDDKISCSDMGKDFFVNVINNEIEWR